MFYGLLLFTVGFFGVMSVYQRTEMRSHAHHLAIAPLKPFLKYRRGVQAYLRAHPNFSGEVPLDAIKDNDELRRFAPNNRVISHGSTLEVVVWFEEGRYKPGSIRVLPPENRTVGVTTADGWMTSGLGNLGHLPADVPIGCLVSDVIVSGV